MGTINNESRELNNYRIEKFGLREIFRVFFSSCFVGLRKPESDIYRLALDATQIAPEECCFIDDRAGNLEGAAKLGMRTIRNEDAGAVAGGVKEIGRGSVTARLDSVGSWSAALTKINGWLRFSGAGWILRRWSEVRRTPGW